MLKDFSFFKKLNPTGASFGINCLFYYEVMRLSFNPCNMSINSCVCMCVKLKHFPTFLLYELIYFQSIYFGNLRAESLVR